MKFYPTLLLASLLLLATTVPAKSRPMPRDAFSVRLDGFVGAKPEDLPIEASWTVSLKGERYQLFVRLDPCEGGHTTGELRVLILRGKDERTLRMQVSTDGGECPVMDERGTRIGQGRAGTIVEFSIPLAALGLSSGDGAGMLLRLLRDGVEVDRLPRYGELPLLVPDPSFEQTHWHV